MHQLTKQNVIEQLSTNPEVGLQTADVKTRLESNGENKLVGGKQRTLLQMLIDQFKDFTIIILMIAAVISIVLGEHVDGVVILLIVVLNAALGTYQENKASNALKALESMANPKAKLLRNGKVVQVDSTQIVKGDIVILEAGDFVPADLRLLESINLKIDESALTGESVPSEKDAEALLEDKVALGDKINMAFSGTMISYGRGKGVVTATGMETEIGHIAEMLNTSEDEMTPLQKKLAEFGKLLGIICISVSVIIVILGLIRGQELLTVFMTAVSLAVAAIPEGLPAVVTTVLALGMQRMVKRHAIMKRLSAVETLGSTTTICSDKTGTLTQNKMTVVKVFANMTTYEVTGTGYSFEGKIETGQETIESLIPMMSVGALCNDALIEDGKCIGDPTEGALVVMAEKAGIDYKSYRQSHSRFSEFPFDSDRKLMSTAHEIDGQAMMLTKGATDELIRRCSHILINGERQVLSESMKAKILNENQTYAEKALRVIAYAHKVISKDAHLQDEEKDLTFLGFSGMIDPPREEAIKAIKTCKKAGIRVVMITGDHIVTASAIAKALGIIESSDQAALGHTIDDMSEIELIEYVKHISVFARVSPEHKVRIVKAIKADKQVVAMTGDGVNDAPALKNADIGVAMGITGTDVSKEAADMILTDDNFASIVSAVEEGRIIYSNIRKFVGFLLSCNVGEILIIFVAMLMNWGTPLIPIQLLWVNLMTDSFPAFALGMEKGEKGIMNERPRDKDEPIVDKRMGIAIGFQSIGLAVGVLVSYLLGDAIGHQMMLGEEHILGRTFAFSTLIIGEMLRAYSARREDKFVWQFNPFGNKYLNLSVLLAIGLLIVIINVPILQPIFHTQTLTLAQAGMVTGLGVMPLLFGEISKAFTRKM